MKKLYLIIPLAALTFFSCRKAPDLSDLQANFFVQTDKQAEANLSSYKTYFISDTIALATDKPNDSIWVGADALQLVNSVKANMNARGYTFVARTAKPDLGVSLNAIKNLNVGVMYPGWWWGGYYGGCYWGYCGYPPYYGYTYPLYYTITTGTLIIDMADLKNAGAESKLNVPWLAVISGGLGLSNDDIALGVEAINQAYTQSPYIKAAP